MYSINSSLFLTRFVANSAPRPPTQQPRAISVHSECQLKTRIVSFKDAISDTPVWLINKKARLHRRWLPSPLPEKRIAREQPSLLPRQRRSCDSGDRILKIRLSEVAVRDTVTLKAIDGLDEICLVW